MKRQVIPLEDLIDVFEQELAHVLEDVRADNWLLNYYQAMFVNVFTRGHTTVGKTPLFLPNDRDATAMVLHVYGDIDPQNV